MGLDNILGSVKKGIIGSVLGIALAVGSGCGGKDNKSTGNGDGTYPPACPSSQLVSGTYNVDYWVTEDNDDLIPPDGESRNIDTKLYTLNTLVDVALPFYGTREHTRDLSSGYLGCDTWSETDDSGTQHDYEVCGTVSDDGQLEADASETWDHDGDGNPSKIAWHLSGVKTADFYCGTVNLVSGTYSTTYVVTEDPDNRVAPEDETGGYDLPVYTLADPDTLEFSIFESKEYARDPTSGWVSNTWAGGPYGGDTFDVSGTIYNNGTLDLDATLDIDNWNGTFSRIKWHLEGAK